MALLCDFSSALADVPESHLAYAELDQSIALCTPGLTRRWAKRKDQTGKSVRLEFKLTEKGGIEIPESRPAIKIYNSSGNVDLDQYAISCLRRSAPFRLTDSESKVFAEKHSRCLATFNPSNGSAVLTTAPAVNMQAYVLAMQQKIQAELSSPDLPSLLISSAFIIDSTGKAKDIRIVGTKPARRPVSSFEILIDEEKQKAVEEAAVKAIEKASPFGALPSDSPDEFKMNFTFLLGELRFKSLGEQFKEQKRLRRWKAPKTAPPPPPAYMLEYLKFVIDKIRNAWKIPAGAETIAEQISFDIQQDGAVKNISLDIVTGDNQTDRAAIEAVELAAPFGPLPAEAGKSYRATVNLAP
ncbi:MAG: TonB C-terminal domain-containing protein [Cyanobacteria bacterium REEB67]|nr:TonB C-terminal domain-containing protein [Cyanobacteria bacterium REEB67]